MGFWDFAGKMVKEAVDKVGEVNDKANFYADKYSDLSKEELIRKYKNSSNTAEKMGISKVMKKNGWLVRD